MNPATEQISIIKANGMRETFVPEKLEASLQRSGASAEAVESVLNQIVDKVEDGMTTSQIYHEAFRLLHEWKKPIAYRYSLRRAIMDLGPSGFPFEKFVAKIFENQGYETLTDQTVLGGCVPHEIDVVAWNDKKLIMVEAKFHNELGNKSDLKVVLYVKARIDDLKDNVFNYGGKNRKLDEGWLVTNTKFSSTAIHYGSCQNLTMIGWNYPEKGNLQDMVIEQGLHPVTCLSHLTPEEKKQILASGVVLCATLKDDPSILEAVLGSGEKVSKVLEEINEL